MLVIHVVTLINWAVNYVYACYTVYTLNFTLVIRHVHLISVKMDQTMISTMGVKRHVHAALCSPSFLQPLWCDQLLNTSSSQVSSPSGWLKRKTRAARNTEWLTLLSIYSGLIFQFLFLHWHLSFHVGHWHAICL